MGQTEAILAVALTAVIVLLTVVLILLAQTKKEIRRLQHELNSELRSNLHNVHDSLVNIFGSMTNAYGEHVNAVLNQSLAARQISEQHYAGLERMTGEHLLHMEEEIETLQSRLNARLTQAENEQAEKLEEIRLTVDEKLNEKLEKRLNDSFSLVCQRLEQMYTSLSEVHTLAGGVNDLRKMLGNVKTRGIWGEIRLGSLLAETLTDQQYRTNVQIVPGSGERVEFALCLPGKEQGDGPVYLPMDSKFPMEAYVRLTEASQKCDAGAAEEARKALLLAVKTEAKRIGKYIVPPYSTDFAVMFLPMESLYSEVMCNTEAADAIRREEHVLIAGPGTLQALLSSLQMGFRTLAIEKRSAEVWKLLGSIKNDFHNYALLLQKTQEKLQQATDSVDTAFNKTKTIEKRLRNVENIDSREYELPEETSRIKKEMQ